MLQASIIFICNLEARSARTIMIMDKLALYLFATWRQEVLEP